MVKATKRTANTIYDIRICGPMNQKQSENTENRQDTHSFVTRRLRSRQAEDATPLRYGTVRQRQTTITTSLLRCATDSSERALLTSRCPLVTNGHQLRLVHSRLKTRMRKRSTRPKNAPSPSDIANTAVCRAVRCRLLCRPFLNRLRRRLSTDWTNISPGADITGLSCEL